MALVTGVSMDLGEAFARELAMNGANIVVVVRSEDKLNLLAESCGKRPTCTERCLLVSEMCPKCVLYVSR